LHTNLKNLVEVFFLPKLPPPGEPESLTRRGPLVVSLKDYLTLLAKLCDPVLFEEAAFFRDDGLVFTLTGPLTRV